jgi:hypothetical protein
MEQVVQEKHPDLRLVMDGNRPTFRGSFQIVNDGEVIDRFSIEITFPDGITKLPRIREIGGRIPQTPDRHVYDNGAICTEVPELTLLRGKYSLVSYLDGPVRNYFLGQLLIEQGERWPFGEWAHGKAGLLQAYAEILGVSGEPEIRRFLDCLGHKKVKGHWPCPCANGKQLRACHLDTVRKLQESVPPSIARQALDRLNLYTKP